MVIRRPTILVAWVQRLHFFRRLAPRPVPVFRHLIKVLHATLAVNRYCHRDAPKRYGPVTGDEHKFYLSISRPIAGTFFLAIQGTFL